MSDKITYEDLKRYEFVLGKVPSLLLGTMIKRNSNLIGKFESTIVSHLGSLNELQQKQLNIILNSDIADLQNILKDAYEKSGKKQYKLLSEPKAKEFIEKNLDELRKLVNKEKE